MQKVVAVEKQENYRPGIAQNLSEGAAVRSQSDLGWKCKGGAETQRGGAIAKVR